MGKRFGAGLAVLALLLAGATRARAEYILADLGTHFQFGRSIAFGINDAGQVVGQAIGKDGTSSGFLYNHGTITHVGYALYATNASGQAAGVNPPPSGNPLDDVGIRPAFLYTNGIRIPINDGPPVPISAKAINNAGDVVGGLNNRAYIFSGGNVTLLGTLGGKYSMATGINNNGQVVGYADMPNSNDYRPFLYSNGKMSDLSSQLPNDSFPTAINNAGQVVGRTTFSAFLYSGGKVTLLGTLGGYSSGAAAINDAGQVVGSSYLNGYGGVVHAFLYKNGKMIDLNTMISPEYNFTLLEAFGINNKGQIVGVGYGRSGPQAFLLTPTDLPEPTSLILLGTGALSLAGYAWRRKRAANAVRGSAPCTAAAPAPARAP
jgi:probable HAF family extracellular repeat protein